MDEIRNPNGILIRNPECKRSIERPGPMWVSNIKMDIKDKGQDK
jgi:hypothetical protein